MKVEKLTLRNFRNVGQSEFSPDPGLNFLIGKNGQGKTSFLEALGYLSTLKSFRGAKSEEVIRWGEDSGDASAIISSSDGSWKTELRIYFEARDLEDRARTSKRAFINGKAYHSSTQYLSQRFHSVQLGFHSVVFNPSDHDLIRGEPSIRRSYLDRVLAAENVEYLKTLQRYQRTLEQRNSVLKSETRPDRTLLLGFTEPLVEHGARLVFERLNWLKRLSEKVNFVARQIAPNEPLLTPFYVSNWVPKIEGLSLQNKYLGSVHFAGQEHLPSLELLEQAFWLRISALEQAELEARSSLVGPHRDDWTFLLGEHVLKGHGSQGEVRSALLALKLCEIELFREQTSHRPLLLLDDFSSELDRERREFLLRFLRESQLQVFVTTTEESRYDGKRFWVLNGTLQETNDDPSQWVHDRQH